MKYLSRLTEGDEVPVAPHWGAWIEITCFVYRFAVPLSHSTGVRGLKYTYGVAKSQHVWSHPTGVRGLKYYRCTGGSSKHESHPTGVRGLK